VPTDDPFTWKFEAEVSSGTYIRALARDLGETLGCGGALAELRRTRIGSFVAADAVQLLDPGDLPSRLGAAVVPLDEVPLTLPSARIGELEARSFRQGGTVAAPPAAPASGECAVFGPRGNLLGIGVSGDSRIRPSVVLPGLKGSSTAG
jgi:tRNA pseudouridine55 synthase